MRSLFFWGIAAALALTACGGGAKPADVLTPSAMQAVMWDIVQADVFASDFIAKDTARNDTTENLKLQQQVFLMHHTTREVYYKSFDYYKNKPDVMKAILDSINAMVNRKKRTVAPPAPTAPAMHMADSIPAADTTGMRQYLQSLPVPDTMARIMRKKRPPIDAGFKQKKTF